MQPGGPTLEPVQEEVPGEPEVEDPAGALGLFVDEVDKSLKRAEFADIKALLHEAIETPVTVSAAESHTLT